MDEPNVVVPLSPEARVKLNEGLLTSQGVSPEIADKIVAVHGMLDGVLEFPEDYDDPVRLVELYELWLQTLWNFPQDTTYHIHWVRMKGCTCPKMDNRMLAGVERRLISKCCPWHYP